VVAVEFLVAVNKNLFIIIKYFLISGGLSSGSTGHRVREAIRSIGKPSSSGTG